LCEAMAFIAMKKLSFTSAAKVKSALYFDEVGLAFTGKIYAVLQNAWT
jgi:hypothetical protein